MYRKRAYGLSLALALVLVAGLAFGCGPAEEDPEVEGEPGDGELSGVLDVSGSTTVAPIGQAWAEAFMDENPEVDVEVRGTGSGDGIADLINDTTDVAMASRPMENEEQEDMEAMRGEPAAETVVARDAMAVVVNEDNPVDELTEAEVKAIFTGEITNWEEVGGEDRDILVYTRDTGSGTYFAFIDHALDGEEYWEESMQTASNAALAETISQEDNAIGYVGLGFIDPVKPVGIKADEDAEALFPEAETADEYPYVRPLHFYTAGDASPLEQAFMDFGLSEEGQDLVLQQGFLPVQ